MTMLSQHIVVMVNLTNVKVCYSLRYILSHVDDVPNNESIHQCSNMFTVVL